MKQPKPLTRGQKQVIGSPGVTYLGRDAAGRPVVSKKRLWSDTEEQWALTRDGEPVAVTGTVRIVTW